jgi:hypothetical protein
VNNTESPAERVAGTLALDIYEGRIKPGTTAPAPDELMSAFAVLRPTAIAALTRLERAGLLRGDQSGTMYVLTDSSPGLAVTAAAAMCRRLAAQAGSASDMRQHIADLGELREAFLSAARRAMRDGITEQDPAVAAAREVLVRGDRVADPGHVDSVRPSAGPARGGVVGWRSVGSRTADFPDPVQPAAAPARGGVVGWRPAGPRPQHTTPPRAPRTP